MKTLYIWLAAAFLFGCTAKKEPGEGKTAAAESKVLSFERTASMDTITANIDGSILGLPANEAIKGATIKLVKGNLNYRATSDPDGVFRFRHVPAGIYILAAGCEGYAPLQPDTLSLGSGDVSTLKIGLGKRTQ